MDTLFPGRDEYTVLGQLERVRSMFGGGQGRGTCRIDFLMLFCSVAPVVDGFPFHSFFGTESNARRDDHLGLDMSFTMVQANLNRAF